jgi:hypothetical protein
MRATARGFTLEFTQPLGQGVGVDLLKSALAMESWTYRDAPDYGSPELDLHAEAMAKLAISTDRRSLDVQLASTEIPKVHPHQTPRIYHFSLASQTLFEGPAPSQMHAYYTLKRFAPKEVATKTR